ncbi:glycoside hydrolase family 2 protein [Bifidobacterium imperatoris]|uniref:Glycoside hydrolase family 2 protein n=1 Tax=Bifidobacterium imperatoris TaxID=2020965 RepID=A0A2N5ISA1_9BIFI|nr:glycoside hydrolase family 2 TIM barrel-domain containing protein [Bifidobacterium imperatoris]PLS24821.1 sugar-binding protein [Bifidobacterium imperatoris]QSY57962.1 glycoside hydrolase family 2 protein [Bifidobacterium imperatoris]
MKRVNINSGWQFRSISSAGKGAWQSITLPHDAMIHEPRTPRTGNGYNTGYYPGGSYEYRTTLDLIDLPAACLMEFEGVYPGATVLVNNEPAGELAYGYGDYYLDIADLLHTGSNTVTVLVDNSHVPNSRWYSGSGIYRPVWLWTGEHTDVIRPDTVRIDTVVSAGATASATVTVNLDNPPILGQYLNTAIIDADGDTVAEFQDDAGIIDSAQLWSPDSPTLYTAQLTLHDADGTILDTHTERFGIRTLTCDAQHGLCINGKRIILNGGCVHHDNGILGAATLPQAEYRRARIMKNQGFNAIRSAHNPLSKAFLDVCDELGLLVMDEAFDMWWMHKTSYDYAGSFREHYAEDLASMVRKDRNHPSVVLYSIGNEIADTKSPRAADAARSMCSIIRGFDSNRPIIDCVNPISLSLAAKTQADMDQHDAAVEGEPGLNTTLEHASGPAMLTVVDKLMPAALATSIMDRQTNAVFNEVDVAGLNYCRQGPEYFHRKHPDRVFCASETYPQEIAYTWPDAKRLPYLIGDFVWTGWDYIGEASVSAWAYSHPEPYGWMREYGHRMAIRGRATGPYRRYPGLLGGSGLIDITGMATSQMLYRQIVTGVRRAPAITVRPMQLLYGDGATRAGRTLRFIERGHDGVESWSWSGYEGRDAIVQVFSGGKTVQLTLNGKVVGTAPVRQCMAEFHVPYEPGKLVATAYDAHDRAISSSSLVSASAEMQVTTQFEQAFNPYPQDDSRWESSELIYESIALTDAHGIVHVTDDRRITVLPDGSVIVGAAVSDDADGVSRRQFVSHDVSRDDMPVTQASREKDLAAAAGGVLAHTSSADAELRELLSHAELLGVASANPITADALAGNTCTTYFGRAQAIWRVPSYLAGSTF